ncbi:MAG: hypothetical protein H7210_10745 [Pyrinomonadaceae bacterium]|nr:hypothetical protein [Phycisphaerales bacterium]
MRFTAQRTVAIATALIGLSSLVSSAQADVVHYNLHNHPDGAEAGPFYGMRLDELYDATPGHDIFSFDFDAPGSDMKMDVDLAGGTIRIFGVSVGGRDVGSAYAADQYSTQYVIDMFYQVGVQQAAGDNDILVDAPPLSNWGSILPIGSPSGAIALTDFSMGGYSLRIGDEADDAGHRGFDGISGWGWINHGSDPTQHTASSDFLFTAVPVPTPGAAALAAMGMGMLGLSRKRRS